MNKLIGAFLVILFLFSCYKKQESNFDFCNAYQLQKPDEIWRMPFELNEISGIVLLENQKILAENDEEGKLFIYDLNKKSIEKTIFFGKNNDYEDVTYNGNSAYALRSDGTIFEIKNYNIQPIVVIHHTFLSKDDDTEGIFFDVERDRLLIACKGNSTVLKGNKENFIYEFTLKNNKLNPEPIITISQKEIRTKYKSTSNFSPSGIAIHPITKNIFIISSVGKMMAEYSLQGKLLNVFDLNYTNFLQPEGISFAQNGDLYISNEAKKKKANILKFKYLN